MSPRRQRVLLSWSSGKDSAWCLHKLQRHSDVEVVALLTTFNEAVDRVAMHAVPRALVERQAAAIGAPLIPVMLPWPCTNEDYATRIADALTAARRDLGITAVAFGDLFLQDVRDYRERQMAPTGLDCLFPLWQRQTKALAVEMIDAQTGALLTCVDPRQCPAEFVGREFDRALLDELPDPVDPCGENGEFHTFVYRHPAFRSTIDIVVGETVERDGFVYCDVYSA